MNVELKSKMMKSKVFKCMRCEATLTEKITFEMLNTSSLNDSDDAVKKGVFSNSTPEITAFDKETFLIHYSDSKLIDHKNIGNYFGCCGHHQTEDLNQICPNCGLAVATLVDECWTYRYVAFDKEKIKIMNYER